MTLEQSEALATLLAFVTRYERAGRTRRQFWAEFDAKSAQFETEAAQDGADADFVAGLYEIRDAAHEGFGGPEEQADDLME